MLIYFNKAKEYDSSAAIQQLKDGGFMLGVEIYSDDDYVLKLNWLLFGAPIAKLKARGISRKASRGEWNYFTACLIEMEKIRITDKIKDERFRDFYRDFCEALAAPGFARHREFFSNTPEDTAARYRYAT